MSNLWSGANDSYEISNGSEIDMNGFDIRYHK